ncbi:hypothetical protein GY45DRAFT_638709 [Cubamyces sp. BRFM 1775]|nr:hypothetical protein GY45DRAFT_638709 [Cubamyces sp. BRFM 1775]
MSCAQPRVPSSEHPRRHSPAETPHGSQSAHRRGDAVNFRARSSALSPASHVPFSRVYTATFCRGVHGGADAPRASSLLGSLCAWPSLHWSAWRASPDDRELPHGDLYTDIDRVKQAGRDVNAGHAPPNALGLASVSHGGLLLADGCFSIFTGDV